MNILTQGTALYKDNPKVMSPVAGTIKMTRLPLKNAYQQTEELEKPKKDGKALNAFVKSVQVIGVETLVLRGLRIKMVILILYL